jgi:hypothetical protein
VQFAFVYVDTAGNYTGFGCPLFSGRPFERIWSRKGLNSSVWNSHRGLVQPWGSSLSCRRLLRTSDSYPHQTFAGLDAGERIGTCRGKSLD